jgi:hypothetical protein
MMPVPPQGVGPEGQPPETPGGMPMPQDAMGQDPMAEPQEMPPTGGAAMPSNIPPEILAQLLAQGAPLPNTQGGM